MVGGQQSHIERLIWMEAGYCCIPRTRLFRMDCPSCWIASPGRPSNGSDSVRPAEGSRLVESRDTCSGTPVALAMVSVGQGFQLQCVRKLEVSGPP